jgi:hypothetical protein
MRTYRAIVATVHQPYAFNRIDRSVSPLNRVSAFACGSAAVSGPALPAARLRSSPSTSSPHSPQPGVLRCSGRTLRLPGRCRPSDRRTMASGPWCRSTRRNEREGYDEFQAAQPVRTRGVSFITSVRRVVRP